MKKTTKMWDMCVKRKKNTYTNTQRKTTCWDHGEADLLLVAFICTDRRCVFKLSEIHCEPQSQHNAVSLHYAHKVLMFIVFALFLLNSNEFLPYTIGCTLFAEWFALWNDDKQRNAYFVRSLNFKNYKPQNKINHHIFIRVFFCQCLLGVTWNF